MSSPIPEIYSKPSGRAAISFFFELRSGTLNGFVLEWFILMKASVCTSIERFLVGLQNVSFQKAVRRQDGVL